MNINDWQVLERFDDTHKARIVWTAAATAPVLASQVLHSLRWGTGQTPAMILLGSLGILTAAAFIYWRRRSFYKYEGQSGALVPYNRALYGAVLAAPFAALFALVAWFTTKPLVERVPAPSRKLATWYAAVALVATVAPLVSMSVPNLTPLLYPAAVFVLVIHHNYWHKRGNGTDLQKSN